jgi:serine/threonine-protein kinase
MSKKSLKLKKKIGRYAIEKQIGKGSAANIYLAKQDSLERKLVIKELLPLHSTNEKIVSRFQREARIISKLTHDAIVHIYDYWVRNNSYYIAMEYVQGKNLREIINTTRFVPLHIAAIIIYQICRGLDHAHGHGIVHRDLKPANIIISDTGQVKILDFGIAHFQYDENVTSLGAVIGTYNYMSPEQALGKKVTPASDVFSIGTLFYELITGFKPFSKDKKGDVLEKIIRKGYRSPRRINPAVPKLFVKIIRKCLRKKPGKRYQSTEIIKMELEKILKLYSLDHQKILKDYLQNMLPYNSINKWPPSFKERVWYRVTHLKMRTYILLFLIVISFGIQEYTWISNGFGLQEQWNTIKKAVLTVWEKIDYYQKDKTIEPLVEPDIDTLKLEISPDFN